MKISCLQENLAKGLSIVGRAVATRSTLPVLSNILLATEQSRLKLSATNLEVGINCWVGAKVEDEGATTVPARLLSDFVHSMPLEPIEMEFAARTQTLHLRCTRYEANIKTIDAQEFPLILTNREDQKITLEAEALRQMIEQVVFAAAADESRPVLTGVLADLSESRLTLAAADGYRLSVRTSELPEPVPQDTSVIIPARALQELARISGDEDETIEMILPPHRNQVFFHMTNIDLVSQLVDGMFPNYKQIIPKTHATRTVMNTRDLLNAIRVALLFARDSANIVRLNILPGEEVESGRVIVSATSAELGDNVSELDGSIEGEPIEIALNAKYLVDVLSVIEAAQVSIETTTPSSPAVVKPVGSEDFVHVIMPMHIAR